MEKMKIGVVTVNYDYDGTFEGATFKPTLQIELDEQAMVNIKQSGAPQSSEDVQSSVELAELVLGAWFSKMNDIELADRSQYEVVSTVVQCEKYLNGNVMKCVLAFSFQLREGIND